MRALRLNATFVRLGIGALALVFMTTAAAPTAVSQVGFRDFSYGTSINHPPTTTKPESKVWWNDGNWWACLFNTQLKSYDIYRLDGEEWVDTGTPIDNRPNSAADVLWDQAAQKLYVASHIFSDSGSSTSSSANWGRLYRFTYQTSNKVYSEDSGFPVNVTKGISEALVLAKDSTGQLWVTFVQGSKVMVNHSTTGDNVWATPFVLPVSSSASSVTGDDLSSVISFGGNKIGVMWSNQSKKITYFAVHADGAADNIWQTEEKALGGGVNCTQDCSDDHINLKTDSAGRIYAAIKTSEEESSDARIRLLVRSTGGTWSSLRFATKQYSHTRPIVELDTQNNRLYMFATAPEASGSIYYKSASLTDVDNGNANSFSDGLGSLFIKSPQDPHINDASSTKQNLNNSTGLLVIASDDEKTHYYVHNHITLGGPGSPTITSFNPTSGPPGTSVTINGTQFTSVLSVEFAGVDASSFTVNSSTRITATVAAATSGSGPIVVTTAAGTATSASNFTVTGTTPPAPVVTGFSPQQGPAGTQVVVSGVNFTGAISVAFGSTAATAFTVNNDTQITTTVPSGATTGPISVTSPGGTDVSSASFTVTGSTRIKNITFEAGSLTDPNSGADEVVGPTWVFLDTAAPLKGTYAAHVANSSSNASYLKEDFTGVNDLYVSFYLRLNARPPSNVRIAVVQDSGTSTGNIYLLTDGALTLRNSDNTVGSSTAPLAVGQLYRVGLHQKIGSGSNAVLEGFLAQADAAFGSPFARLSNGTWTTQGSRLQIGATIGKAVDITVDDIRIDAGAMPGPSVP